MSGSRAARNVKRRCETVIPVVRFPDGSYHNESTRLVYDLEQRHTDRSVIPDHHGMAFLAHLIEDFADEWVSKAMFGYRWLEEVDQIQMSRWLGFDALEGGGLERSTAFADQFRARQVGRMPLVGCTRENFALIEASARGLLGALEKQVTDGFFLFGSRPSLAEFGLYGQLSQLAVDPTPQALMRAEYPYAYRWVAHMEDLSGIMGYWSAPDDPLPPAVEEALRQIGAIYAPFLLANAKALDAGDDGYTIEVEGHAYSQAPFKFQARCLADLRARYAALDEASKAWLDPILAEYSALDFLKG